MKLKTSLIALACMASPLIHAGTPPPPPVEESSPRSSDWWFSIAPNVWTTAVQGDMGFGGFTADAGTSFSENLDNLDLGFLTHIEFGRKRWGIGIDGIYAKISDGTSYEWGPISGDMKLEMEQAFVGLRVQYKILEAEDYSIELFAGARWNYIAVDTEIRTVLSFDRPLLQRFNRERSRSMHFTEDWIDPIVGARGTVNLSDRCSLVISGEVGGFGVGSEFTWQALVGVGYQMTQHTATFLGYRALGIDYDDNGFKMDTVTHGPSIALIFKF